MVKLAGARGSAIYVEADAQLEFDAWRQEVEHEVLGRGRQGTIGV